MLNQLTDVQELVQNLQEQVTGTMGFIQRSLREVCNASVQVEQKIFSTQIGEISDLQP